MRISKNWSVTAGLCLIVTAAVFSGCSDDEDKVTPNGSAGKAGSAGGSSAAGKNGNAGGTGSDAGGEGGMSESGGMAAGGMQTSTMAGAGGDAGAAGGGMVGAVCGDGHQDAGEECDDGNTKNGDGCSSKCTSKCEACEAAHCSFSTFPAEYNDVSELCFKAATGDVAIDGPAKGAQRSKLCTDLVECIRTTKCIGSLTPGLLAYSPMQTCYCGVDANGMAIDCVMAGVDAKGPCVKEFQRAAESEENSSVASRLFDLGVDSLGLALGRATLVAQNCDLNECANECYFGKESDACSRCTIGDGAHEGFDTSMATCGAPAITCGGSAGCSAVVACARQTKCAGTNLADCYADGAGPCATQIKTASGLTDVAAIKAAFDPSKATDLGYAASLIGCMKSSCNAQCFP